VARPLAQGAQAALGQSIVVDGGPVLHRVWIESREAVAAVGAGDAFLALAGLCLGGGLPPQVAAFAGSVAAGSASRRSYMRLT